MSITKRGAKSYLVRVYMRRDPLTGRRVEINETVRGNSADAKKVEARLKGQVEAGRITNAPRLTVDRLLDLYLDSARHSQAASTQHTYRESFDRYVRPYVGSVLLRNVTSGLLQDLFNLLLDERRSTGEGGLGQAGRGEGRGLSPGTVYTIRGQVAAAFNYASRQKLIPESPVTATRLPPAPASKADCLTVEEAGAFVSVKDEFRYGDAFVFQLHTGLRPQELMALIWEDVDFERGTFRVERACKWINGVFIGFGPTKTRAGERTIELAPAQLELLRAHRRKQQEATGARKARGEPYCEPMLKEWAARARQGRAHLYHSAELIFPTADGRAPNYNVPHHAFKVMLRRAGVGAGQPSYRWYDLRHTHASFLIDLGVPLTVIAARMGHSVAQLIKTYAHLIKGKRSDAPDLFARLVPVEGGKPSREPGGSGRREG